MALSYICQKAKTIVVLEVRCSQRPELRWPPHTDTGNPPFRAPFGARQAHTEEYLYCAILFWGMARTAPAGPDKIGVECEIAKISVVCCDFPSTAFAECVRW
jgi:hypothetical protein